MEWRPYSREELRAVAEATEKRSGWDFSRMATESEPAPWDYLEVASRYIGADDTVLDIGTGGGERFLRLSERFGVGIGIDPDPEMIEVAVGHTRPDRAVRFSLGSAEETGVDSASIDVVLTRHAPVHVPEVHRVTKPGGLFVVQQVGADNMANIRQMLRTGSGTRYTEEWRRMIADFQMLGWRILATAEYDVRYWVKDLRSLLFWLGAIAGANEVPADFGVDRYAEEINLLIARFAGLRGLETNEHRMLLIACKGSAAG